MTATMPDHEARSVRRIAENLPVPEGWRVEIIGGTIVMSPTPAGWHAFIVRRLDLMLTPQLPDGYECMRNLGVNKARGSEEYSVPDLFVVSDVELQTWDNEITPDEVLLAAEVVSRSNPDNDRVTKVSEYAEAGIPLYLLVDPLAREMILYSDPQGGEYQARHRVEWGGKLELPEPLPVVVDSSRFPDPTLPKT